MISLPLQASSSNDILKFLSDFISDHLDKISKKSIENQYLMNLWFHKTMKWIRDFIGARRQHAVGGRRKSVGAVRKDEMTGFGLIKLRLIFLRIGGGEVFMLK